MIRRCSETDLDALAAIVTRPEVARWWDDFDRRKLRREIEHATLAWTIEELLG